MNSLSRDLVSSIMAKAITDADRLAAAGFVMDTFASAIAGQNTDQGRMLLKWATLQRVDNRSPMPAQSSAFLLGALTHILEIDDVHRASITHPGCAVVPAAWAVARREGADSISFLDAVLRGYEAICRVGSAVGDKHYKYWHNTATCGPFGSVVAAGSLLGLSEDEMVHAFGNAGTQSAGLWEFLDTGAMSKHLHAGRAAEAGVLAADLARQGFTGPPAILEGDRGFFRAACPDADPAKVLADFKGPWQLTLTSIKPWPSCRHTHPAIDAAAALKGQLNGAEIDHILVRTYQAALDLCDRSDVTSEYEAKFSLQHTVAAGLGLEKIDFAAFDKAARNNCAETRAKVQVTLDQTFEIAYPGAFGSAVEVYLSDGSVLTEERLSAKGDPEAPLSEDELIEKAGMLLNHSQVSGASVSELGLNPISIMANVPKVERAISAL